MQVPCEAARAMSSGAATATTSIDPGDNSDVVHGSSRDDPIVYTGSGSEGFQELGYSGLGAGVTVTIDGADNRATVDKGAVGTDTIVDFVNALNGGKRYVRPTFPSVR